MNNAKKIHNGIAILLDLNDGASFENIQIKFRELVNKKTTAENFQKTIYSSFGKKSDEPTKTITTEINRLVQIEDTGKKSIRKLQSKLEDLGATLSNENKSGETDDIAVVDIQAKMENIDKLIDALQAKTKEEANQTLNVEKKKSGDLETDLNAANAKFEKFQKKISVKICGNETLSLDDIFDKLKGLNIIITQYNNDFKKIVKELGIQSEERLINDILDAIKQLTNDNFELHNEIDQLMNGENVVQQQNNTLASLRDADTNGKFEILLKTMFQHSNMLAYDQSRLNLTDVIDPVIKQNYSSFNEQGDKSDLSNSTVNQDSTSSDEKQKNDSVSPKLQKKYQRICFNYNNLFPRVCQNEDNNEHDYNDVCLACNGNHRLMNCTEYLSKRKSKIDNICAHHNNLHGFQKNHNSDSCKFTDKCFHCGSSNHGMYKCSDFLECIPKSNAKYLKNIHFPRKSMFSKLQPKVPSSHFTNN